MTVAQVFSRVSGMLDRAGIDWMLTGSFASNYYGAPRSTQDIDLVISATPQQIRALISQLPENEYYFDLSTALEAAQHHSMFNVIDFASGWKIDFIFQRPGIFHQQAFQRRQKAAIEGVPVFVATAEDVIIAKLEWAKMSESSQQITDVARILQVRWEQLDHEHLNKWVGVLGLTSGWNEALRRAEMPPGNPQP